MRSKYTIKTAQRACSKSIDYLQIFGENGLTIWSKIKMNPYLNALKNTPQKALISQCESKTVKLIEENIQE